MEKANVYKIEVPANRYDLLCLEGIATALRCYIHKAPMPEYRLTAVNDQHKVYV